MSETTWRYLAPNPKSSYKQLFIKGTRIRAETIPDAIYDTDVPQTPEQVAADYGLPVEAVREAIAYCAGGPPEIARDRAAEEAIMEATGMNDPEYKYGGKYKLLSAEEARRLRQL